MKLNEYKIVGAPDPYHFRAPNNAVATVAMLYLGEGQYGHQNLKNSEDNLPMFRIAGSINDWCERVHGMNAQALINKVSTHTDSVTALYQALESITLGMPGDSGLVEPPAYRNLERQGKIKAEKIAVVLSKSMKRTRRH